MILMDFIEMLIDIYSIKSVFDKKLKKRENNKVRKNIYF